MNRSDPISGLDCCHSINPFTKNPRICCDCDRRCCAEFKPEDRDCFWPEFAHPTWLCCHVLYGCDQNHCPFEEEEAEAEDLDEDEEEDREEEKRRRKHHHH